MVSFTIPGNPVPKGRPRVLRSGRTITPKRTVEYEAKVHTHASTAMEWNDPTANDVTMTVRMWFKDKRRRDIDNAAKSILDGMNDVVYVDDSQVVELHLYKAHDKDNPRAEVEVAW